MVDGEGGNGWRQASEAIFRLQAKAFLYFSRAVSASVTARARTDQIGSLSFFQPLPPVKKDTAVGKITNQARDHPTNSTNSLPCAHRAESVLACTAIIFCRQIRFRIVKLPPSLLLQRFFSSCKQAAKQVTSHAQRQRPSKEEGRLLH